MNQVTNSKIDYTSFKDLFKEVFSSLIISECCACRRVMAFKEGFGVEGVSHGYCPECEEQLKSMVKLKIGGMK